MTRVVRLIGLLFCLSAVMPVFALDLEPIPAGADIVLLVNNHSALPLGTLLDVAPVPPPVRQKINEFLSATGFNPLKDVTRVQVMVKKGPSKPEDHAAIVLTGSFNKEKILQFLSTAAGPAIVEEKLGDLTLMKSKDGKGGLCFLDASHIVLGTLPAVKTFIEAKGGSNLSTDYDSLRTLVSDKAYVALMVGGKEVLKNEFAKNQERRQKRQETHGRRSDPGRDWFESYVLDTVEPTGIFAQILDNKAEVKVFYARGGTNTNSLQASLDIHDPVLTIEAVFQAFLKVLPTLVPTGPKETGEDPKENTPPAKQGW